MRMYKVLMCGPLYSSYCFKRCLLENFSTGNQFDSEPIHTLQQRQYVMGTFMSIRGELYGKNKSFALPSTAKFHCIPANVVENITACYFFCTHFISKCLVNTISETYSELL